MSLDFSNRGIRTLDELELPPELVAASAVATVDVSRNRLSTLSVTSPSLVAAFEGVRHLVATNNRLTSLEGLDRWAHRLEVLDLSHTVAPLGSITTPSTTTYEYDDDDEDDEGLVTSSQGVINGTVLARLAHIHTVSLSGCGLDAVRLLPIGKHPPTSRSGTSFAHLQELYLSHNNLTSLPDVSKCHRLAVLDVSHNAIRHLNNISRRLPAGVLQALSLQHNALSDGLSSLVPLSYLADALTEIHIAEGNDDCWARRGSPPQWGRGLIAFLCPHVTHVDARLLSPNDRQFAESLFRNEDNEELDETLLSLLEDGRSIQLHTHLRDVARHLRMEPSLSPQRKGVGVDRRSVSTTDNVSSATDVHPSTPGHGSSNTQWRRQDDSHGDESRDRAPIPASHRVDRLQISSSNGSAALTTTDVQRVGGRLHERSHVAPIVATSSSNTKPPYELPWKTLESAGSKRRDAPMEDVVTAMQERLFLLQQVTSQLWQRDAMQKHWAAVRIQSAYRGYVSRRRLPRGSRQRLGLVHARAQKARAKPWMAEESIAAQSAAVGLALNALPPSAFSSAASSPLGHSSSAPSPTHLDQQQVVAVQQRVHGMDRILRQLFNDVKVIKHFISAQHKKAALCIQTHYRAYRARCVWRRLKADYEAFQRGFVPAVKRLQDVGRRFIERRKIIRNLQRDAEHRRLKDDVAWLRESVKGLQHTVQLLLRERRTSSLALTASGQ